MAGGGTRPRGGLPRVDARLARALLVAGERFGTPTYVTDLTAVDAAAAELAAAFGDPWLRHYVVAANPLPATVARLAGLGLGAAVTSSGEWRIANAAGVPNARIVLEGRGKGDAELRSAVQAAVEGRPLRWVTVESASEAAALDSLARRAGLGRRGREPVDAVLRLRQPDGAELTDRLPETGPGLRWRGLALPLAAGQLTALDAWRDLARRSLALLALLAGAVESLDTVDIDGGLPVPAGDVPAPTPATLAAEIAGLLGGLPEARRPGRLALASGRFLVARSGWLVARVLHVDERSLPPLQPEPSPAERAVLASPSSRLREPLRVVADEERTTPRELERTIGIDAGLPDLLELALLGQRHPIVALTSLGVPVGAIGTFERPEGTIARVMGVTGSRLDNLFEHELPPLRRGDLVAIARTGAYASSMSSSFEGRPSRPEVLVEADGSVSLARRRGSIRSVR